jgi:hypothetical protein
MSTRPVVGSLPNVQLSWEIVNGVAQREIQRGAWLHAKPSNGSRAPAESVAHDVLEELPGQTLHLQAYGRSWRVIRSRCARPPKPGTRT